MPIVISHTPPMELLSRAGYYIGAGEMRQQQEEMQQRERMQIRGIEANLLSQQLAQQNQMQRDVWGAQMDQQRLDQQQQHQLELQGNQQQMQQKLAEIRQQDRQDALQAKMQANELNASKFRDGMEWDQAKHLYGQSDDVTSLIRDQLAEGLDFDTPQQRAEYENKLAEIDKIRKDPTLREIQKAQGVYELATRLPIPKKRIPTTEEQLNQQLIKMPDPNNPGKILLIAPDRDGNPRLISGGDSGSAKEDTAAKDLAVIKEKRQRAYNDAYKILTKKDADGNTIFPSAREVEKYLEQVDSYADPDKQAAKEAEIARERQIGPVDPHSGKRARPEYIYDPSTGEFRGK